MSDQSKILTGIIGTLLTAIVGAKSGWHIEIKGNCIGLCSSYLADKVLATRNTIVAEDDRHHVELLPDGRYIGRDRKKKEQIIMNPNPNGNSWSNKQHLYELIAKTSDNITIRVTYPDGHQSTKVLHIKKT